MISYDWAVNKFKLEQAQNVLKAQGIELTEANIKAQYILQGGAVLEKLPIFEDGETDGDDVKIPDLEDMSVKELKDFAKLNGIDLGKAKTKAEILDAITTPLVEVEPKDEEAGEVIEE